MNKLKAYTLTVLLSTLTFAQESRAATIAPPLSAQVKQVTQWFTGFFDSSIDALDQIFNAQGNLIVNTPIEFHRIKSIPEPDSTLGLLALGLWSIGSAVKRKPKQKSTEKDKASV
jgi:predicted PurR-regulated permease PerM